MNTKQCNIYVNNKFALANILEHFLLGDSDFHQGQLEDLERFYGNVGFVRLTAMSKRNMAAQSGRS